MPRRTATTEQAGRPAPPAGGPYDVDQVGPDATPTQGVVDFGALRVPVPAGGSIALEPTANGRMQAVHVNVPEGRLSISALAAPKSARLWPDLAKEIDASLREGGARVRSFPGEWGRELHATTGAATSVFVGVDGPRWMVYGVATGPTRDAVALDARLRRMMRGTLVVRGRSPYPVRTVLPLEAPEDIATPAAEVDPMSGPSAATTAFSAVKRAAQPVTEISDDSSPGVPMVSPRDDDAAPSPATVSTPLPGRAGRGAGRGMPPPTGRRPTASGPLPVNGRDARTSGPLPVNGRDARTSGPLPVNGRDARTSGPLPVNGRDARTSGPLPVSGRDARTSGPLPTGGPPPTGPGPVDGRAAASGPTRANGRRPGSANGSDGATASGPVPGRERRDGATSAGPPPAPPRGSRAGGPSGPAARPRVDRDARRAWAEDADPDERRRVEPGRPRWADPVRRIDGAGLQDADLDDLGGTGQWDPLVDDVPGPRVVEDVPPPRRRGESSGDVRATGRRTGENRRGSWPPIDRRPAPDRGDPPRRHPADPGRATAPSRPPLAGQDGSPPPRRPAAPPPADDLRSTRPDGRSSRADVPSAPEPGRAAERRDEWSSPRLPEVRPSADRSGEWSSPRLPAARPSTDAPDEWSSPSWSGRPSSRPEPPRRPEAPAEPPWADRPSSARPGGQERPSRDLPDEALFARPAGTAASSTWDLPIFDSVVAGEPADGTGTAGRHARGEQERWQWPDEQGGRRGVRAASWSAAELLGPPSRAGAENPDDRSTGWSDGRRAGRRGRVERSAPPSDGRHAGPHGWSELPGRSERSGRSVDGRHADVPGRDERSDRAVNGRHADAPARGGRRRAEDRPDSGRHHRPGG